ncbi:hypothetical protein B4Q13_25195 [Lacticaseibacillus rhamnosus]
MTFAPWGQLLVTGGLDRFLRWWDVRSGKQVALVAGNREGVIGLAFAPDNEKLTPLGVDRQGRHIPSDLRTCRLSMRERIAMLFETSVLKFPRARWWR